MKEVFTATILKDDTVDATGIQIPADVVAALGKGKRPPVKVGIAAYAYRTTVAVMGGMYLIPLSAENRKAAGVKAGDVVTVSLELDEEPRVVLVPDELVLALAHDPVAASAFESSSYSVRKEYARQVESAKTAETRTRRISSIRAELHAKHASGRGA